MEPFCFLQPAVPVLCPDVPRKVFGLPPVEHEPTGHWLLIFGCLKITWIEVLRLALSLSSHAPRDARSRLAGVMGRCN